MTKEKLVSLQKYANDLKNRLSSPVPASHAEHPATFKAFLNNELRLVIAKLEEAKLTGEAK